MFAGTLGALLMTPGNNVSLNSSMALKERESILHVLSLIKLSTHIMLQSLFSEIYPLSLAAAINSKRN